MYHRGVRTEDPRQSPAPAGGLTRLRARLLEAGGVLSLVHGLPGAGRPALADRLAGLLGAELVSTRATRDELFPGEVLDAERRYGAPATRAVYAAAELKAEAALRRGSPVVLTGTYPGEAHRVRAIGIAHRLKRPCLVVCVWSPGARRLLEAAAAEARLPPSVVARFEGTAGWVSPLDGDRIVAPARDPDGDPVPSAVADTLTGLVAMAHLEEGTPAHAMVELVRRAL